jgi:hypothetical protein
VSIERLVKRRESLFTIEEVAFELGVTPSEVELLELSFLSPLQRSYLTLMRYRMSFFPASKHYLDDRPRKKPHNLGKKLTEAEKRAIWDKKAANRFRKAQLILEREKEIARRISTL